MSIEGYGENSVIQEIFVEIDDQGRFIHADQRGFALLGYTAEDLAADRSLIDLISEADQKRARENLSRILKGERMGLNHYAILSKSGQSHPALIYSSPREDGRGLHCTIFLLPPSSRFTALIYEHQQMFQTAIEALPCGIVKVDAKGRISYWNSEAEKITGLNRLEVIGQNCHKVFNCRDYKTLCPLHNTEKTQTKPFRENMVINCKGNAIHLNKISNFIYAENGMVTGAIGSFIDLTQQHNAEAALSEARELLESARKAKRHFMSNMNHEIRTPINGILGILDLMLTETVTPSQREYITNAKRSAHILLDLIENILDFSIIDKGALKIELAGFSLNSVIASVINHQYDLIQNKEVCIHSYIDNDVPDNILGDSGRLYQILKHLVGNSIKFTPAGEVAVHVSLVPPLKTDAGDDARKLMLHFSISDTGVGIPKDKLQLIFESLSQLDDSHTRSVGGLGIGLNTVHRLVQLLEGRIWMESELDKGTTAHIILPFKKTSIGDGDYPQAAGSKLKPSNNTDLSQGVTVTTAADPKSPAIVGPKDRCLMLTPVALSRNWHLKFKKLKQLAETDLKAAEKLLFELKQEAKTSNQQAVERLLLRLLLALRREDRDSMNQYYEMLKRKLNSAGHDTTAQTLKGEFHENIDRRR